MARTGSINKINLVSSRKSELKCLKFCDLHNEVYNSLFSTELWDD
jgi:hypothetical protein